MMGQIGDNLGTKFRENGVILIAWNSGKVHTDSPILKKPVAIAAGFVIRLEGIIMTLKELNHFSEFISADLKKIVKEYH